MFLTEREKAEDLAHFKQAAKSVVERARKDNEYARQVLRDIGIPEHTPSPPQQKPAGPTTTTRNKPKPRHQTSPKAHS